MLRKLIRWVVPVVGVLGLAYLMLGHYLPNSGFNHQTSVQADRQSLQGFHRMNR